MIKKEPQEPLSQQLKDKTTKAIFDLKGPRPNLAIIIIGHNHEYFSNIKNLELEAKKVGVDTHLYICDEDSDEQMLIEIIDCLNKDEQIDAIYVQRPLLPTISLEKILENISPAKDVNFEENFADLDWNLFEARLFKMCLDMFVSEN